MCRVKRTFSWAGHTIEIIKPSVTMLTPEFWLHDYPRQIEEAGRTCYKSEKNITPESAITFIGKLLRSGHLSVLEHLSITVLFIGDRSMSHQLVRHRIAAYSQESQRYCNYGKKGFQVILPPFINIVENDPGDSQAYLNWRESIGVAYSNYCKLLEKGILPEDARSVLPNATKTEIVTTFNLRQWRHVFEERALNPKAQWQIRGLMLDTLKLFHDLLPAVFRDQYDLYK